MTLFLLILAVAAGYVVSLYLWPFRPCPRCSARLIPGTSRGSSRKRFGLCKRCKGSKSVQRAGSRTVHRAVRALAAYHKEHRS